jgi:succinate dehydrogenase / fumarate reductase, cytochrome b subunit
VKNILCSTVGKKAVVGLTGFFLSGFTLLHMSGNLILFAGGEAYNKYTYQMTSNKAFAYTGEVILALLFVVHILLALSLANDNRKARPVKPTSAGSGTKRASFASRTMVYSGLLLLVFLYWHLKEFRFGMHYTVTYGGVEMRDMFRVVMEEFRDPVQVAAYSFFVIVLGLHLNHGVSAFFQSLGLASSLDCRLRKLSWGFCTLVAVGFLTQPLYIHFTGGQ